MNPFRYGKTVPLEFQCPQPALERTLLGHLRSGQNVLMQGDRRMGKSSFLTHALAPKFGRRVYKVDFSAVKSVDAIVRKMIWALEQFENSANLLNRARKGASRATPAISVGGLSLSFDPARPLAAARIEEVLTALGEGGRRHPILCIFDEFQDILRLPPNDAEAVLAQMRSVIQHQTDVPYIFAGSNRNRMHGIFNHPASPFFKSAATVEFGPIPIEAFTAWITARFSDGGRKLPAPIAARIFEATQRVSGDVQQLCSALWNVSSARETLGDAHLDAAIDLILGEESKTNELIWAELSERQASCLQVLAANPLLPPAGADFARLSGIHSASTVTRSLDSMTDRGLLFKQEGRYSFFTPFFRMWVHRKLDLPPVPQLPEPHTYEPDSADPARAEEPAASYLTGSRQRTRSLRGGRPIRSPLG